jgi:NAD(P)-dependent dehydrogenase (short-subunit alcohol dehydrogenase family)
MADFSLAMRTTDLTLKEFGRIDGIVINHGMIAPVAKIADTDPREWGKTMEVNLISAVAFVSSVPVICWSAEAKLSLQAQATIPELRKSKGCIVMTSSGAAVNSYRTWGAYGASKSAMMHLGQTIAAEEPEIMTLSIAPGVVDTDMQKELREQHIGKMGDDGVKFQKLHEEGKLLPPEKPGNVMARLVLDGSSLKDSNGKFLR